MPLAKLQRFGEGRRSVEDRFIYDFTWREEVGRAAVARPGFDDSLRFRPGVGNWLIRLASLIRPLVQAKWAARVADRNADLVDSERLHEFLFGVERVNLARCGCRSPRPRKASAPAGSPAAGTSTTSSPGPATRTILWTTSSPRTHRATEIVTVDGQTIHTTVTITALNQPVHITLPPASQTATAPGL